jgi:hypothetical protein
MKIFYASSLDCKSPCYAYEVEEETPLDPNIVGGIFTFVEYGWKEGTVTEKGRNEKYSYYQIQVEDMELV